METNSSMFEQIIKSYEDIIRDMKQMIKDQEDRIKDMNEEMKEHVGEKKGLQELLDKKEKDGYMKQDCNELKEQIDHYEERIRNMKEEIVRHIRDKEDLQGLIEKKEHDNQQQIKQKDSQIKELVEDNEEKNNEINRLNAGNTGLEGVIKRLKEQLDIKDSQIRQIQKGIKDQLEDKNDEINKFKGNMKDLESKIRELEQKIDQQKRQVGQEDVSNDDHIQNNPADNNDSNIDSIQQLKQCENVVHIQKYSDLDDYKKQIEKYQQDSKQYQIIVDFTNHSGMDSIGRKMGVLEMINRLDGDRNVGEIGIGVSGYHELDSEIVRLIINRYTSVYSIVIWDYNGQIDSWMHGWIKKYVQQQPIMGFVLLFYGSLYDDDNGYELVRQYNQLIKQKQCIEYLAYGHDRIGGTKYVYTEQKVQELIDEIDKL